MQPRPKRVGSSLVNISASIGFSGCVARLPERAQRGDGPNHPQGPVVRPRQGQRVAVGPRHHRSCDAGMHQVQVGLIAVRQTPLFIVIQRLHEGLASQDVDGWSALQKSHAGH